MVRTLISMVLAGAVLMTAGCANSVLNDPEEMARRHAEVERDQARWDAFNAGIFGGGSASDGNSTAASSGGSASSGSSPSVKTQAPRRCYQTSKTHQTCFD